MSDMVEKQENNNEAENLSEMEPEVEKPVLDNSSEALIKHIDVEPGMKILEAKGLVKRYKRRKVVDGVDLRVTEQKIVGLLGPNGAGKTTSFYMMVGLIRPNAGRIFLNGKEITKLPIFQRSRLGLGYLAQQNKITGRLTARRHLYSKISRRDRFSSFPAAAESSDRMALAVRPCLPITLPRSSLATRSSTMIVSPSSRSVTSTASG